MILVTVGFFFAAFFAIPSSASAAVRYVTTLQAPALGGSQGGEFAVNSDYIYYCQDTGYLSIWRKSDWAMVGCWAAPPDKSYTGFIGLLLDGDDLYCGSYGYGVSGRLWRMDVSDPGNPHIEYTFDMAPYSGTQGAGHMIKDGGWLYVAVRGMGFLSVGISNPYGFVVDQVFNEQNITVNWLVRQGNYIIVAGSGLWVYDISNPSAIVPRGNQPLTGQWIDMVGDTLYAGNGWSTRRIFSAFDASNPTNISLLGSFFPPGGDTTHFGQPFAISPDKHYAFILDSIFGAGSYGLYVVDISDPSNMRWVDFYDTSAMGAFGGDVGDACLDGNYLYVSKFNGDIVVFDVSDYCSSAVIPEPSGVILAGLMLVFGFFAGRDSFSAQHKFRAICMRSCRPGGNQTHVRGGRCAACRVGKSEPPTATASPRRRICA